MTSIKRGKRQPTSPVRRRKRHPAPINELRSGAPLRSPSGKRPMPPKAVAKGLRGTTPGGPRMQHGDNAGLLAKPGPKTMKLRSPSGPGVRRQTARPASNPRTSSVPKRQLRSS